MYYWKSKNLGKNLKQRIVMLHLTSKEKRTPW